MLKSILLCCSFICILVTSAQEKIEFTGSNISPKDAQDLLTHHNKVRKDVRTTPLIWSSQLAKYAQEWANHLAKDKNCKMAHRNNPGQNGNFYGENIFWGSSAKDFKPLDASKEWYSEISSYKYEKLTEKNWHASGHYTQMVWKDTREVGVGVAFCSSGGIIIVANYFPAGNYMRQFPY
jgi:pathogenesis-related protein 1